MMFGWDENEEEVDLDLRIRDWEFEDSSATAWGAPITFISIKSRKTRQTFYAVWVETRPGKFSRLYKFDNKREALTKFEALKREGKR